MDIQVPAHMRGFGGVRGGNYFGRQPVRRTEVEVRVGKLKNGKAGGKDEIIGEMEKGGSEYVTE